MIDARTIAYNRKELAAANARMQYAIAGLATGAHAAQPVIGARVVSNVRGKLNRPGRGRIYVRDGRLHRASAPGDPPASQTGRLARSYYYRVSKLGVLTVASNARYAKFLEFGTSVMAARPHLRPAMEEERRRITATFALSAAREVQTRVRRMPRRMRVIR